jgi:hypothetical protein
MLMKEFVSRFVSNDERSSLFTVLRQVSRLDTRVLKATSGMGWMEWPPVDDPDSPDGSGSLRVAQA